MTTIAVEIKDDAVSTSLARVAEAMSDLSPLMNEIALTLADQTDERFRTGTDPDGNPWRPRSPVTLAAYARRGDKPGPRPLLGASLQLSRTIHSQAGSDYAEIGSSRVQAAVMQFGAAQGEFGARMGRTKPSEKRPRSRDYFVHLPWGDIPARPFIGLSEGNRADLLAEIDEWLGRAVSGA